MYHYNLENAENIGLHDCRANRIEWNDDVLSFYIPDGIWILQDKEPVRTDSSKVDVEIMNQYMDGVDIYLFKRNRRGKVIREEWELENFMNAVNEGAFELEFLYKYQGYQSILYKCCVWFEKAPYHYDCEIEMRTEKITYRWNSGRILEKKVR